MTCGSPVGSGRYFTKRSKRGAVPRLDRLALAGETGGPPAVVLIATALALWLRRLLGPLVGGGAGFGVGLLRRRVLDILLVGAALRTRALGDGVVLGVLWVLDHSLLLPFVVTSQVVIRPLRGGGY